MNKETMLKAFGIFFIALTGINFILFVFGVIGLGTFWFVLVLCALVAYFGLPKLKEHL